MVLGGEDEVFHARLLRHADPGVGVKLHRGEVVGNFRVLRQGNPEVEHHVLALPVLPVPETAILGIKAPMDEHAKPGLTPPLESLGRSRRGCGGGGRRGEKSQEKGVHRARRTFPAETAYGVHDKLRADRTRMRAFSQARAGGGDGGEALSGSPGWRAPRSGPATRKQDRRVARGHKP